MIKKDNSRSYERNILFLTPYPFNEAPSQRFRFEQYFNYLNQKGIKYRQNTFFLKKDGKTFILQVIFF
ncbi:hypothetical protein [Mangrovivirga cuniculi]|uniref:Uncharacterized protein n=1 Tax=Mangrovivirga cuniculi TaxID=2715131 RepID=A0A4D7K6Y2_9BACT|nr:hypothetical protein [Mangrovivirga cuniculi]QCK16494.1 hypothetical protein DCC35_18035 [Mangrovivirga cuniculi]